MPHVGLERAIWAHRAHTVASRRLVLGRVLACRAGGQVRAHTIRDLCLLRRIILRVIVARCQWRTDTVTRPRLVARSPMCVIVARRQRCADTITIWSRRARLILGRKVTCRMRRTLAI